MFSCVCSVRSSALSHRWLGYLSCQQAPKRQLPGESLPPCVEEWKPVPVKEQTVSGVHAACHLALILTTPKCNLQSCLYSLLPGSYTVFMCQLTHVNVKGDHYRKTQGSDYEVTSFIIIPQKMLMRVCSFISGFFINMVATTA